MANTDVPDAVRDAGDATTTAASYFADLPEVVVVATAETRDLLLSKRVVDLVRVKRVVRLDVNETEWRAGMEMSGALDAPVVIVVTLATVAIPDTALKEQGVHGRTVYVKRVLIDL